MITINSKRLARLSELRRHLHSHPELSLKETATTNFICEVLSSLDIEYLRLPRSTGAVGLVHGRTPGPCLGLRADIDALPIREKNQVPYRSVHPDVMHACGHDANTAIMLGVAQTLAEEKPAFRGSAKFIFQPAEEKEDGAKLTIAQGVLESPRVDRVIAGHMTPSLDVGKIGIFKDKGYAAADLFTLSIEGTGGHGGRPHQTRDPLTAGAYFVTTLQTLVSRQINPIDPAVISVGRFEAGRTGNVIPETARLDGTIRTHSDETRQLIHTRLKELALGMEQTFLVKCTLEIIPETPGCHNDPTVATQLFDLAQKLVGPDNVYQLSPTMGSEDFAYFTLERPSAIVRIGCRNTDKKITAPLHSPWFDIDEQALEIGVQLFYQALLAYLAP